MHIISCEIQLIDTSIYAHRGKTKQYRNRNRSMYMCRLYGIVVCTIFYMLLLLYISGNETKDPSKSHLSTAGRKPEETCKQGRLIWDPETPG